MTDVLSGGPVLGAFRDGATVVAHPARDGFEAGP